MDSVIFENEESTSAWARTWAPQLPYGCVVGLCGPLGAGKTTLVRASVEALGGVQQGAFGSPTFSLINEYLTPDGLVFHLDFYRLETIVEAWALGFDELKGRAIFVEWADKFFDLLPPDAVWLHLTAAEGGQRVLHFGRESGQVP
ncbi:MAG: tRNA (adenosine(37)-N6)-threonylcarbamoyltransferase complex ATPase subunit type 1 TsaE [Verrucomicrobiales bacterium]